MNPASRLALDIHHELYRQAEAVVDGRGMHEAPGALPGGSRLVDRRHLACTYPVAEAAPLLGLCILVATALVTSAVLARAARLQTMSWVDVPGQRNLTPTR